MFADLDRLLCTGRDVHEKVRYGLVGIESEGTDEHLLRNSRHAADHYCVTSEGEKSIRASLTQSRKLWPRSKWSTDASSPSCPSPGSLRTASAASRSCSASSRIFSSRLSSAHRVPVTLILTPLAEA